mgnify:FL=1
MKNLLVQKDFYLASSNVIPCKGERFVGYRLKECKNDFSVKGVVTSTVQKISLITENVFLLKTKHGNYVTSLFSDSSISWLITPEKPVVGHGMKNCQKLNWVGENCSYNPYNTEMVLDTLKVSRKIYLAATRRKIYICYIADM